ncbi:MAG: SUMF1/EgtB/PvdO family nonheme iron enzyme [Bacteroidota bacterium]
MNKYRIVIITVLFIFSLSLPTLSQSDEGGCQRIEVETQLLENAFMMNIVCNPADNENASNNVVDLSQIAYGTSDSIFILGEDEGFGSISTAVPLPICFVWHVQDTSDNTTLPLSCTNDSREFSQDIFAADRWWNNGVNFIAYQIYFEDLDSPINLCPPQEEDRCYTDIQLISEITIDEQLNTWQELATQDRANTLWNPIIIEFPLATSESNIPTAPMVLVPNGSIARGETGEYSLVEVEPFWIDRFEATIELYTQVTDDNTRIGTASYESDHPVTNISYNEAQNFCELRNMRLPTQSEWEFAARGVDALRYPWGEEFPQLQDADDYLWVKLLFDFHHAHWLRHSHQR